VILDKVGVYGTRTGVLAIVQMIPNSKQLRVARGIVNGHHGTWYPKTGKYSYRDSEHLDLIKFVRPLTEEEKNCSTLRAKQRVTSEYVPPQFRDSNNLRKAIERARTAGLLAEFLASFIQLIPATKECISKAIEYSNREFDLE